MYKYIFKGDKDYQPFMKINEIDETFQLNNTIIETFKHNHGSIDVQTYKIGKFAYSTDLKKFYNSDIDKLKKLDLWIVGLLREDDHPSHAGLKKLWTTSIILNQKNNIYTYDCLA